MSQLPYNEKIRSVGKVVLYIGALSYFAEETYLFNFINEKVAIYNSITNHNYHGDRLMLCLNIHPYTENNANTNSFYSASTSDTNILSSVDSTGPDNLQVYVKLNHVKLVYKLPSNKGKGKGNGKDHQQMEYENSMNYSSTECSSQPLYAKVVFCVFQDTHSISISGGSVGDSVGGSAYGDAQEPRTTAIDDAMQRAITDFLTNIILSANHQDLGHSHEEHLDEDNTITTSAVNNSGQRFMGRLLGASAVKDLVLEDTLRKKCIPVHLSFITKALDAQVNEEFLSQYITNILRSSTLEAAAQIEIVDISLKRYRVNIFPSFTYGNEYSQGGQTSFEQSGFGFVFVHSFAEEALLIHLLNRLHGSDQINMRDRRDRQSNNFITLTMQRSQRAKDLLKKQKPESQHKAQSQQVQSQSLISNSAASTPPGVYCNVQRPAAPTTTTNRANAISDGEATATPELPYNVEATLIQSQPKHQHQHHDQHSSVFSPALSLSPLPYPNLHPDHNLYHPHQYPRPPHLLYAHPHEHPFNHNYNNGHQQHPHIPAPIHHTNPYLTQHQHQQLYGFPHSRSNYHGNGRSGNNHTNSLRSFDRRMRGFTEDPNAPTSRHIV